MFSKMTGCTTLLHFFAVINLIMIVYAILGPADLKFKKIENCEPACNTIDFWIKQWRVNRTFEEMNITLDTPIPMDSSVFIKLNASAWKEGGWKPGALYIVDTFCQILEKMLRDTFDEMLRIAGHKGCPLPEGNYIVSNFYFDNSKFNVPRLYGDYKMETIAYRLADGKEDILGCYILYYSYDPKEY